mgnify:CR=1 FL=1
MRFTSRITSTVTTAAAAVQPREMPASIQALRPGATSPEEASCAPVLLASRSAMPEIFAGTFRGVGDSVKPTVITCLCVCVVRVVWLMTAVKLHHTLFMLCICYPMTWILTATVFAAVYLKGDWLRKRIPEEGL